MSERLQASGTMATLIGAHDWVSTPLGSPEDWPGELRYAVKLMLASPQIASVVFGTERVLLYNDAAATLYGDMHPGALGRPLSETWPEAWKEVSHHYERVFAGDSIHIPAQPLDLERPDAGQVFEAYLTPVCDAGGTVIAAHMTGFEIGARLRAQAALRKSEETLAADLANTELLRSLAERLVTNENVETIYDEILSATRDVAQADAGIVQLYDPDTMSLRLLATSNFSRPICDRFSKVDASGRTACGIALKTGQRTFVDFANEADDAGCLVLVNAGFRSALAIPLVSRTGEPLGMLNAHWHAAGHRSTERQLRFLDLIARQAADLIEQRQAQSFLRESEEKYRSLFETMGQGYSEQEIVRDKAGRAIDIRLIEANARLEVLTGLPRAATVGKLFSESLPGLEPAWIERMDRVVLSGEPEQFENEVTALGRWYSVHAYPRGGERYALLYDDITERKQAEIALHESKERQAFLLKLSDALRPLADPLAIQDAAARILGEQLNADRAYYAIIEGDYESAVVERDYVLGDARSMVGRHFFADFPMALPAYLEGRPLVIGDVQAPGLLSPNEQGSYDAVAARAVVSIALIKDGGGVATMTVLKAGPHAWTEDEIALVIETGERTWAAVERARAEAALRESEMRFQQFARASSAGLWIREATTLSMEYVSPAISAIYGVEPNVLLGNVERWGALIVPEDRDTAFKHLEAARRDEAVVHEFRIRRPSDGVFRWIRNTDFPLYENGSITRIGGIADDVTETRRLVEHQHVLLAELQHRVRNIMGMIRSMANRTVGGALEVEDYRSLLEGRLLALARVQALLTREANAGGSLRAIIESEVAAQAHRSDQFTLTGPDIKLSPKAVEVLTLAFHELTTNALNYGAFSGPDGRLTVSWTSIEKRGAQWLALDWVEQGAPPREPSRRRGFGSELIEARIPYELGGRGKITLGPEGARCHLEFPLKDGESILETDAPQSATIFGGSLDVSGAPDLTGQTVLVVEDDYYMAQDTAAALRGAGAEVLGPCPHLEATLDLLEDEVPTHAVLDLNLGGGGPQFEIARLLKGRGVPFIFLTGYDPGVIPADMEDIVRLQKPVPFLAIIEAVSRLSSN